MKSKSVPTQKLTKAITLLELLFVALIIGLLIAMFMPVSPHDKRGARNNLARIETSMLGNSILAYHSTYGRYPVTSNVETSATIAKEDFTFGGPALNGFLSAQTVTPVNAEVVAILMDRSQSNFGGASMVNSNHSFNPQHIQFLRAKLAGTTNEPGVGPDGVYRDPWGHPYIISMDLNGDGRCRDAFYKNHSVSRDSQTFGFNGLTNTNDPTGMSDSFELNGGVMVWSLGADGKADSSKPANVPPNKDNILSWK